MRRTTQAGSRHVQADADCLRDGWTDVLPPVCRLQKLAANAMPTDYYKNSRLYRHVIGGDIEQDPVLLGPGIPGGAQKRSAGDLLRYQRPVAITCLELSSPERKSGGSSTNSRLRHRHQEFLRSLNDIDTSLPSGFAVHLIMDSYSTHEVSKVQTWFARHPRYHLHVTPTSANWLNLVERLFAEVADRCVPRGSHNAVRALERAMLEYLNQRNLHPKLFVWTTNADLILGKFRMGSYSLSSIFFSRSSRSVSAVTSLDVSPRTSGFTMVPRSFPFHFANRGTAQATWVYEATVTMCLSSMLTFHATHQVGWQNSFM